MPSDGDHDVKKQRTSILDPSAFHYPCSSQMPIHDSSSSWQHQQTTDINKNFECNDLTKTNGHYTDTLTTKLVFSAAVDVKHLRSTAAPN
ncbi:hypothetical protein B566_EDAN009547, partial [Ephemera danica]